MTPQRSTLNGLWDRLLDASTSQARAVSVSLEAQTSVMVGLEGALDPMGDGGLLDSLTRMWNRFDELSCRPNSRRLREEVLADAERVAAALRHAGSLLDRATHNERSRLRRRVERANELLERFRENDRFPHHGNDVVDELCTLLAFDPRRDALSRYRLCFQHEDVIGDDVLPIQVRPDSRIVNNQTVDLELVGGAIHGSQVLLRRLLPRQRQWLDELTAQVVESHNRLHLTGFGSDGSTDVALFWPTGMTAGTAEVGLLLAGNPQRVAAAVSHRRGDGSNAMALARLGADQDGPWALLLQGLGDLAQTVADLRNAAHAAALSNDRAEHSRQEGTASSLNRKLASLLATQEALQAASRFDDTLAGVLDTVTRGTGLGDSAETRGTV